MKLVAGIMFLMASATSFTLHADMYEVTLTGSVISVDGTINEVAVGDEYLETIQFESESATDAFSTSNPLDGTWFTAVTGSLKIGKLILPLTPTMLHADNGNIVFINKYQYGENELQQRISSHITYLPFTRNIDQKLQGQPLPASNNDQSNVLSAIDLFALNMATFDSNTSTNVLRQSSSKKISFSINSVSVNSLSTPPETPNVYYLQTGISDINDNGYPEFATLRTTRSGTINVLFTDAISRDYIKSVSYLNSSYIPLSITTISDGNGNGHNEIAVMARNKLNGQIRTVIKDSHTDETLNSFNWRP